MVQASYDWLRTVKFDERLPIIPWHPGGRFFTKLIGMVLQLCNIIKEGVSDPQVWMRLMKRSPTYHRSLFGRKARFFEIAQEVGSNMKRLECLLALAGLRTYIMKEN